MRGVERQQRALFSYISPETRVPAGHRLRRIRSLVDRALTVMGPQFDAFHATGGRPSIPPEQLLRALLLQVLYTVRSEGQLMRQLDYNVLFRWSVGLGLDEPIWDVTVFTKNRERLLAGDVAHAFFAAVLGQAQQARLPSNEHFTVDGTLVQAWAGQKSSRPRTRGRRGGRDDDPGNPTVDFRGAPRGNATHASTTDPEAQLAERGMGQEAKLAYQGHGPMDNRPGLAVQACVAPATGTAERTMAVRLVRPPPFRRAHITLGADQGYDARECVVSLGAAGLTPHLAQHTRRRRSALDGRTIRHGGYAVSKRVRKRVEEVFGWLKTIGLQRQTRFRGAARVDWMFTFATVANNLVRMQRLLPAGGVP